MGKFLHAVGKQLGYVVIFFVAGETLIYLVALFFGSLNNHANYEEWGGIWFVLSIYFFIWFLPVGILYALVRGIITVVRGSKMITPNAAPVPHVEEKNSPGEL